MKTKLALGAALVAPMVFAPLLLAQGLTEFKLSAGDVIEVKFFYNPELNDTIQIRPDGRIALPLIGEVDLRKRSVAETTQLLEELYASHLKTPKITIHVRSYAAQKVYVGGEVLRPGTINLTGELTVLGAIMEAGGRRHTGHNALALLIRRSEGDAPVVHRISLKETDHRLAPASMTYLLPFDVVLVPETRIARIDRWVDQHIRQLVPLSLTGGFTYLVNGKVVEFP